MAFHRSGLVVLAVLLVAGGCRGPAPRGCMRAPDPVAQPASPPPGPCAPDAAASAPSRPGDLAGTSWTGKGWDGSYLRFQFHEGGGVTYTTKHPMADGTWDDGCWARDGDNLVVTVNQGYATYRGTIRSDRMEGTVVNVLGQEGTWGLTRETPGAAPARGP